VDENGKPVSMDKGKSYMRWVCNVKKYGYNFDHRILNAADYGAYTSRKRFFGIFAKAGLPIVFPEPTHCKEGSVSLFGSLEKWRPVRECLDFDDEGDSIFGRKKPLVEATLERIYAGLIKFVAEGKEAFIVKYNSVNKRTGKHIPPSIDEPCPTVATQNRLGLAKVQFLSKQFSGDPMSKNISVEAPAGAITCKDHHAFISVHYGNGSNRSCEQPAPTLTTKDKISLVTVKRLDKPCSTLIARMDKMPPYLVETSTQSNELPDFIVPTEDGYKYCIYDTDTPMMVKIKEFMALYCIVEITMRMLKVPELKKIMGFPEDYVLVGTQAEQKKYIGNAVEVTIARRWCEAIAKRNKNVA
jgi:DNA (cytosine-5)-methyltransferase 1